MFTTPGEADMNCPVVSITSADVSRHRINRTRTLLSGQGFLGVAREYSITLVLWMYCYFLVGLPDDPTSTCQWYSFYEILFLCCGVLTYSSNRRTTSLPPPCTHPPGTEPIHEVYLGFFPFGVCIYSRFISLPPPSPYRRRTCKHTSVIRYPIPFMEGFRQTKVVVCESLVETPTETRPDFSKSPPFLEVLASYLCDE